MAKYEIDDLPLGHYSMRERSRILQREVDKYIEGGYQIIFQDECDAQVFKPSHFSGVTFGYLFRPLILLDFVLDLFIRKDSLILIEVNELGKVTKTEMRG